MTKYFKKSKEIYFEATLGSFYRCLGNNELSWKKELCQFLNIAITYHGVKNLKKLATHS